MGRNRKIWELGHQELVYLTLRFQDVSEDEFLSGSHLQRIVFARTLITYMLIYDGVRNKDIAKIVYRDNASVVHYKKIIMEDLTFVKILRRFTDYMNGAKVDIPTIKEWKKKIRGREKDIIRNYEPKITKL